MYEHKPLLNYTYILWHFYMFSGMVQVFQGTLVKFHLFAFLFLWLKQMLKCHTVPAGGRPCLFFISLCLSHTAQQKTRLRAGPQQVPAEGVSSPCLCAALAFVTPAQQEEEVTVNRNNVIEGELQPGLERLGPAQLMFTLTRGWIYAIPEALDEANTLFNASASCLLFGGKNSHVVYFYQIHTHNRVSHTHTQVSPR